jgi:hypothetical protein
MFSRILIIVFALVITTTFVYTNIAMAQIVTDGLVSYWTFDKSDINGETVKDVWGDNHGTVMGDPQIAEGKIDEALIFDGVDDYIECGNAPESIRGSNPRTFTAWIKTASTPGDSQTILHYGDAGNGDPGEKIRWSAYPDCLRVEVNDGGHTSQLNVVDDEWHFVACTFDGTTLPDFTLYVDGESEVCAGSQKVDTSDDYPLRIGVAREAAALARYFNGIIDEVSIYDRALSEDEVNQNFSARNNALAVSSIKSLALTWGSIKASR